MEVLMKQDDQNPPSPDMDKLLGLALLPNRC